MLVMQDAKLDALMQEHKVSLYQCVSFILFLLENYILY